VISWGRAEVQRGKAARLIAGLDRPLHYRCVDKERERRDRCPEAAPLVPDTSHSQAVTLLPKEAHDTPSSATYCHRR
jgi:hypothetical protein